MKRKIVVAVVVAVWVVSWSSLSLAEDKEAPEVVVEKVTKVTGPAQGYKIITSSYEAMLECNQYGFVKFHLTMDGETVVEKSKSSNGFFIYDNINKKQIFYSFKWSKDKKDFPIVAEPGKITWELNPSIATIADYSGSLTYGPGRIALTHNWTLREDITGFATPGILSLGMPLLIGCPFKALLADGTTIEGDIPAELPKKQIVHAGGGRNKSLKEITFDTVKGKVKISFIPDKNVNMLRLSRPFLSSNYREDYKPPRYFYQTRVEIPLGKKDIPQSYTIVFEFPEDELI